MKSHLVFLKYEFGRLSAYLRAIEGPLQRELPANGFRRRTEAVELHRVEDFLNLLRQSFVVTLLSELEQVLIVQVCWNEGKLRQMDWIPGRGNPLDRAKHFFRDRLGDPFDFREHEEWRKVKEYYNLRNFIVHRQGSLTGYSDFPPGKRGKQLERFIQQQAGLSLRGSAKVIQIEHDFCEEALDTVYELLNKMIRSLPTDRTKQGNQPTRSPVLTRILDLVRSITGRVTHWRQ